MNGEASRLTANTNSTYNTIAAFPQTETNRKEKFSWIGILLCILSGMCLLAG